MKSLVWTIAAAFFVLFVLTTFVPYPPARESASAYFSQQQIDIGLDYALQRNLLFWTSIALELGLLCFMAKSPMVRRWADFVRERTRSLIVAALGVGMLYVCLHELVHLPLRIGRLYHAKAWGMSNLDLPGWFEQHAIAVGVYLVSGAIVVAGLYFLLSRFPRIWWLLAPIGASVFAMGYALLAPILINPLFNDFTPLGETPWRDQLPQVQALINQAHIPVQEILVMNASRQSNHTNAYFAGFGPTRRIVLYDTLLKNHTPDEIESVLAHEIGHWQHDHIVKGILLGTLAAVLGCFLLDRLLRGAVGKAPWHLQSPADPAGLPLILLLVHLGGWIAMPLENAVSRHFERQADEAALELARRPDAFSACEEKMARDNKSDVAPTPWNVWLFSSHPPTVERIHRAEDWKEKTSTQGTKKE